MDKKLTIIVSLVVGLLVLAGIGYFSYLFFKASSGTGSSSGNNAVVKAAKDCDSIVADNGSVSGKAPFSPVLRSKLSKNATAKTPICSWSVGDQFSHLSVPVDGKCVFGGTPFNTPGTYTISLEGQGLNCKVNASITVQ